MPPGDHVYWRSSEGRGGTGGLPVRIRDPAGNLFGILSLGFASGPVYLLPRLLRPTLPYPTLPYPTLPFPANLLLRPRLRLLRPTVGGKRILAQGSGKKEGGEWRGGRREGAWPAKVATPLMEEILHHHALRASRNPPGTCREPGD